MIQTDWRTTSPFITTIETILLRLFLAISSVRRRRLSPAQRIEMLLLRGQRAILSGHRSLAWWSFWGVARLDPRNQEAWVSLATIIESPQEREQLLRRAVAIDPHSRQGRYAAELLEER